jgi:hypothetical protein
VNFSFFFFLAAMAERDFSRPFIIGYGSSPSRHGPAGGEAVRRDTRSLGFLNTESLRTCQVLRPHRTRRALAMTPPLRRLPLCQQRRRPEQMPFAARWLSYAPLPTLRTCPDGQTRTARVRCSSLLLHRGGLSPPTPCRSPGASDSALLYRSCNSSRRRPFTASRGG